LDYAIRVLFITHGDMEIVLLHQGGAQQR